MAKTKKIKKSRKGRDSEKREGLAEISNIAICWMICVLTVSFHKNCLYFVIKCFGIKKYSMIKFRQNYDLKLHSGSLISSYSSLFSFVKNHLLSTLRPPTNPQTFHHFLVRSYHRFGILRTSRMFYSWWGQRLGSESGRATEWWNFWARYLSDGGYYTDFNGWNGWKKFLWPLRCRTLLFSFRWSLAIRSALQSQT